MIYKFTAAIAVSLLMTSSANALPLAKTPIANVILFNEVGAKLSGKERLRRLMGSHTRAGNPITQSVRDATGDPNITVIDHRSRGLYETYTCSYFWLRKNQRVLKCD